MEAVKGRKGVQNVEQRIVNSFKAVKSDILEIKTASKVTHVKTKQLSSNLENMRKGYVRADQFLKLEKKFDNLRGIQNTLELIEIDLKKLEQNTVSLESFERDANTVHKELLRMKKDLKDVMIQFNSDEEINKLDSELSKKISSLGRTQKNQLQKEILALRASISELDSEITELKKQRALKDSKILDEKIANAELSFTKIAQNARELQKQFKNSVSKKDLELAKSSITEQVNVLRKTSNQMTRELKNKADESSLKTALAQTEENFQKLSIETKNSIKDFTSNYVTKKNSGQVLLRISQNIEKLEDNLITLSNNTLSKSSFDSSLKEVNSISQKVEKSLKKFSKELDLKVSKKQVEELVKDINLELTDIHDQLRVQKEQSANATKRISKIEEQKVDKREFEMQINSLKEKDVVIRKSLIDIKSKYVRDTDLAKVTSNFQSLKKSCVPLTTFNKKFQELEKQIELKIKGKTEVGWWFFFFANSAIILAFISILAAIVLYFFELFAVINYLAIAAVVLFIIGIIMRISAVKRD